MRNKYYKDTRITVSSLLRYLIVFCALIAWGNNGVHANPPIPKSKAGALSDLEVRLEKEKADKDKLSKQVGYLEKNLKSTKESLRTSARKTQNSEKALSNLEDQIESLEGEKEALVESMNKDRQNLSRLILALERMRRMPPEVMIARPEDPVKTAQAGLLMSQIVPSLDARAEELKDKVERLNQTRRDLEEKRLAAQGESENLKQQYAKAKKLVSKREALYRESQGDLEEREQAVLEIASQAGTLKELVRKLEQDQNRERTRNASRAAVSRMPSSPVQSTSPSKAAQEKSSQQVSSSRKNGTQLPVSGVIKVGYHDPDDFGAKSEGLKIQSRSGALVVAPMSGSVKYAGEFKKYGKMIILEHPSGYHSLVAGLETINTAVGQEIDVGEPIGVMPSTGSKRPILYYELRYNGSPVNPARKFGKLS